MDNDEKTGECIVCHESGAPLQVDPYIWNLYDHKVLVFLHDGTCHQEREDEV